MSYQKTNLNGFWQLQPTDKKPQDYAYEVPVPAMVDNCQPPLDWQKYNYFWYRKEFQLGEDASAENIYLQLEQVQFGAEVWLNDKKVGYDIPCYTSQWYDLTLFAKKGNNFLLVRVGQKSTLPEHSAVGNDEERLAWLPGIWGDVFLHHYGSTRVEYVQIIPNINTGEISLNCDLQNFNSSGIQASLDARVIEKESGKEVSERFSKNIKLDAKCRQPNQFNMKINNARLWSPEDPFLYQLQLNLKAPDGNSSHRISIPFGIRQFEIKEGHFYLNNKRRVLMGSNIAFHRLLNDSTRDTLLWNKQWIKKAFIDIPKAHNLTFFRFHLGHAYNRWYDLADTYGILLEDEWAFWNSSGTPEQIEKEFKVWLKENFNRPSIVIWNALNESSNKNITEDIIPRLKELDPTRPWQHVDFHEDHPYIYSLGPVLNGKQFGFTRSVFDLQESSSPTMVNEFEWWWLDRDNNPSQLTQIVVERWLGRNPDKQILIDQQAFLAAELGELWRRLDLDAIMPFVYLSVGEGATAHWFDGPLKDLKPKKVLAAYKNTFSPLGISIELWDRHFVCEDIFDMYIYLFNDSLNPQNGKVRVFNKDQNSVIFYDQDFSIAQAARQKLLFNWNIPGEVGSFNLRAEIVQEGKTIAWSEKPVHLLHKPLIPEKLAKLAVFDPSQEIVHLLEKNNLPFGSVNDSLDNFDVVLLNQQAIQKTDLELSEKLTRFMAAGGRLILQEPEYAIKEEKHFLLLNDFKLKIVPQDDSIMGGYNSYVFMEDENHPLWQGIQPAFMKTFNGALGGEIVSAHDVVPNRDFKTLARCGLSLTMPAIMEIEYGKGKVIISRIQLRGRLLRQKGQSELYDRRYDPVAEQYFWNLLSYNL